jgi:hypothetical protein
MNDRKLFDTPEQARQELAKMQGWDAKATPVLVYENGFGSVRYCIQCKQGKTSLWMRSDGYVR